MARETIMIGSVTYAMKAKKLLDGIGVRARLIKKTVTSDRGCTYGLEYDSEYRLQVAMQLRQNGISFQHRSDTGL
jgi:hypothetical protein